MEKEENGMMHPALSLFIWYSALLQRTRSQTDNDSPAPAPGGPDEVDDLLPLPIRLRLDHLRQPSQSGLQLTRFHSERYRKF
jgi:hypothetical protein